MHKKFIFKKDRNILNMLTSHFSKKNISSLITKTISSAISEYDYPPYAYMYPPRTSFHDLEIPLDIHCVWQNKNNISKELGLYVHIPFCKKKCSFCNLFSVKLPSEEIAFRYVQILCSEIQRMGEVCKKYTLSTVYIGGGTPSILPLSSIVNICKTIKKSFQLAKDIEFAIEANPQDVNLDWAKGIKDVGIERVNLGTQTFDNFELHSINRQYGLNTNISAVKALKLAGIQNVSIDLIYGLPNQTKAKWKQSVEIALSEEPNTVSIYSLSRRPNTIYGRVDIDNFVSFKKRYLQYEIARSLLLRKGYKQVTNVRFTTLQRYSYKQQEDHWLSIPILGVGCGAQTYGNEWDYIICSDFKNWENAIRNYINTDAATNLNIFRGYHLDFFERIRKFAVLSIHNFSLSYFKKLFGIPALYLLSPWFKSFEELDLGTFINNKFILNKIGFKFRDILCRTMFSEKALKYENATESLLYETNIDYLTLSKVTDAFFREKLEIAEIKLTHK